MTQLAKIEVCIRKRTEEKKKGRREGCKKIVQEKNGKN